MTFTFNSVFVSVIKMFSTIAQQREDSPNQNAGKKWFRMSIFAVGQPQKCVVLGTRSWLSDSYSSLSDSSKGEGFVLHILHTNLIPFMSFVMSQRALFLSYNYPNDGWQRHGHVQNTQLSVPSSREGTCVFHMSYCEISRYCDSTNWLYKVSVFAYCYILVGSRMKFHAQFCNNIFTSVSPWLWNEALHVISQVFWDRMVRWTART